MTFISYAQNYEDVMLWRALKHIKAGFYIDVGANDPCIDSVTKAFYDQGWSGINIEPLAVHYHDLRKNRPRDINIQCVCGDTIGEIDIWESDIRGWATFSRPIINLHQESGIKGKVYSVNMTTLDEVLKEHNQKNIHFVKIDVEGTEELVLKGINLSKCRPWIFVIEAILPNSRTFNYQEWEQILTSQNYKFAYSDGLNRFYVATEHDEIMFSFQYPPNIFDDFILNREHLLADQVEQISHYSKGLEKEILENKSTSDSAQQELHNTQQELHNTQQELHNTQQELHNTQQELHDAWQELHNTQQELHDAWQELHNTQQELHNAWQESHNIQQGSHNTRQELHDAYQTNHQQLLALEQTKQELHNIHQSNHHHWQLAEQRQVQIDALHNSTSWRISAPLRWAMRLTVHKITPSTPKIWLKAKLKLLLQHAALYVGLRPRLKQAVVRALNHAPNLKTRIRQVVIHTPSSFHSNSSLPHKMTNQSFANITHHAPKYSERMRLLAPTLGTIYYYVDHTVLCPTNTGMQRVTRQLARTLVEQGSQLVFVKWHNDLDRLVLVTRDELKHLGQWGGPQLDSTSIDAANYQINMAEPQVITGDDLHGRNWLVIPEVTYINYHGGRQLTLDIIHAAKRACLRTAFIFYDAIPLRRAELASVVSEHEAYMRQLLLADLIIPISKWSAQDLQDFLIQHEGVAPTFLPPIEPLLLPAEVYGQARILNKPSENQQSKKILCVGSIDERKNQMLLGETFSHLVKEGLAEGWELVFIGNLNPSLNAKLQNLISTTPEISWLGNCSDDVLMSNYVSCTFTVFPSVEEGYGLPIAESLWFGKPNMCANFGPMAEIAAAGGCLTVDMRSQAAIRDGLLRLIKDQEVRSSLHIQLFSRDLADWKSYTAKCVEYLRHYSSPPTHLSKVFYLVDHTCVFEHNTGIQRVVRCLAAGLIRQGIRLIPTKWNTDKTKLVELDHSELVHLAKWNGPLVDGWAEWSAPAATKSDWLLMPEVTTHYLDSDYSKIRDYLDLNLLRACSIFYDTIPWKMRNIYPPQATQGHRLYMAGLNLFELILPISYYSRDQLELFYLGESQSTTGLQQRLIACPLPGEFQETPRTLQTKYLHHDLIEILSVGTLEPRKNHLLLVQAFLQACGATQRPMRLTLAGGGPFPDITKQVKRLAAQYPDQLRWIESPSDTTLNQLYEECDFTVYPSVEEGFGLPILESLWHARPCICMNEGAMVEVATGGGCLMVDTRQSTALANAIVQLAQDDTLRERLGREATERPFRTWDDYASDCALYMAQERRLPSQALPSIKTDFSMNAAYQSMPNLISRPLLSVCISTYNRASWLALSLAVLVKEATTLRDKIEVFVCDNTSTDNTSEVVAPYVEQGIVRYHRNPKNVGMLGNLRSTAQEARGRYIWILGDDDIIKPNAIANIVRAIEQNPHLSMVYLNYAYTRDESPKAIDQLQAFFDSATPVVAACADRVAPIKELAVLNENFFTAIYCIVFERAHALMAYSQFTEGEPFSSLPTCVPTTNHVLNRMMDLEGYWIGEPQIVINMNVSWIRFAWRWILERFPEMHDVAVKFGGDPIEIDRWRTHHLPGIEHFFAEAFSTRSDDAINAKFDTSRLIGQIKHLPTFKNSEEKMIKIYTKAYQDSHPLAARPPQTIFTTN